MRPSPDGRFIAFLRRDKEIMPDSGPLLAWHLISEHYHSRAEVATATGEIISEGVAGIQLPMSESGQMRMGVPPWKDPERYIRNSPIFFVDRVETPVMIVQGDMDYVTLQQGEEFFAGLDRQNKRAAFVRYLGEGHVLQGPANIRDMWQRIFAWFDEFFEVSNEKSVPQR